ncbi:MAG: methylamine utilization protein [Steroidobacteraceae bacterium]|nr:methylamine utilization protein [Steroidobacteraceae bacterium]
MPHPSRTLLGLAAAATLGAGLACASASAATLEVTALQRNGKPLAGAVMTLEAQAPTLPPIAPLQAVMDQIDLAFAPDVLVVPVNSSVRFPNSDAVSHQVYSFSSARKFQLPLYRGKPYPPVAFDEPGIVTLGCNIHDRMLAYIVVTAAPYFGRTDAAGHWSVSDLPAGRYLLTLWHPLLNEGQAPGRVVEMTQEHESLELRLVKPLRPAPLTGRPHSWDY